MIVRANAPFAACLATEATALESRNLTSFFSSADAQILLQRFSDAQPHAHARVSLATAPLRGSVPVDLILRRIFADGRPMVLVSAEPWEAASADDRALEAARLAAESANAAKSDFLTRVSHEIRTPLNAIMGFAEVMMEERLGPIGSPRYKEYLKDIRASGAHVLSLVNDLLDLSKIEAGKMELSFSRVDANATIAECASIMQAQANQGRVVMRLALAAGLPSLRADARSLKQILLNLLSNAVKFNEPGGQVIVSSALNDAGSVVIRVKDTGIGMSEADVATALEPFRQVGASRRASGTGLGLPLTKALIEANHASFSIKSRHNEGTLIEIAFPPPQALAAE
jgi:signal transduction histidine kinase